MGGGSFFIRERVGTRQWQCLWVEEITFWEEVCLLLNYNPEIEKESFLVRSQSDGEGPLNSYCYLFLGILRLWVLSLFFCKIECGWELFM